MPRIRLRGGDQLMDGTVDSADIKDGDVSRVDLNVSSTGRAVVRKVLPGNGTTIIYDGVDAGTGDVIISLDELYHRGLDELVHEISENCYIEISRDVSQRINSIIYYTSTGKTTKVREYIFTRSNNRVSQVVTSQYDSSGILAEKYTETINRGSDGRVISVDSSLILY